MIRTLVLATVIWITIPPSRIPCGHPGEMVVAVTGREFREEPLWQGVTAGNEFPVKFFANSETGTWSFVVDQPPVGLECIMFAGKGFKPSGPLLSPPL